MPCIASRKAPGSSPRNWAGIIFLDSKAIRAGFWKRRNACSPSRVFPPLGEWEKGHGRLDHRRIARVAVSPEEIGLCGCWQVIAVERQSQDLNQAEDAA